MKRVKVYSGVWNGETGTLIEAQQGNTFHRVQMDANKVILAVKSSEYEIVEESELTDEEKNLIKDLIKCVSDNKIIEEYFQDNYNYKNKDLYNCLMDSIFNKLQNGRLTVVES